MKKNIILLIMIIGVLSACDAAINMNGKVLGVSSGKFIFQDGNLTSNYKADMDPVWTACEKTVAELNGKNVEKERKISKGTIKTIIQDEKVIITVEYLTKGSTSVAIFVGVTGNNMASRLIHEKIAAKLATP